MARPPRRTIVEALNCPSLTDWTVTGVKGAVRSHSAGCFRTSSQLIDSMETEPRIFTPLQTRIGALASKSALPFSIDSSEEGDGRKRESALARQRQLFWSCCPESVISPLERDSIMAGAAIGYVTWSGGEREWVPQLHWLPTHGLEWDQWATTGSEWTYTTRSGERLPVTPGDGFWFLHLPHGPRSWMRGLVRPLGMLYIMTTWTERDWARYNEKHGLPILEIDEPFWAHDDVEGTDGADGTKADEYYAQFRTLESESVLRQPQGQADQGGWKARWLEPVADSWESFQRRLESAGELFDSVVLGQGARATPKGGDGEARAAATRVELLSADAEGLATSLRTQIWMPWAAFNYDDPDVAGWPHWSTRPGPDLKLRAETLNTLGDALGKLTNAGVDTAPLLEEFGLQRSALPVAAPTAAPVGAPS